MRQPPKLHPTGLDGLAALAVVVLAVACAAVVWGGQGTGENLTAVVSVDGEEVERINLESEEGIRSYSGHGYTLEVNLRPDGQPGVRVEHADCPTQDCVHTGIITRAGQSIVCLPARIIIRLEGGSEPDGGPDLIIG